MLESESFEVVLGLLLRGVELILLGDALELVGDDQVGLHQVVIHPRSQTRDTHSIRPLR